VGYDVAFLCHCLRAAFRTQYLCELGVVMIDVSVVAVVNMRGRMSKSSSRGGVGGGNRRKSISNLGCVCRRRKMKAEDMWCVDWATNRFPVFTRMTICDCCCCGYSFSRDVGCCNGEKV
jgi:hypothetical protein